MLVQHVIKDLSEPYTVHFLYLLLYICIQNCEYRACWTTCLWCNAKEFTFCSKVGLKRFFLLKIFEDFHQTAAFPNRVPWFKTKSCQFLNFSQLMSIFGKQLLWTSVFYMLIEHLLRWIMGPDKLLCRSKALVPKSHSGVDDVLSISAHHHKPKQQD